MTSALQEAFVLHRRSWSDTSLLLEVFTHGSGRLPLIARGVKKIGAKVAQLQPFVPLWLDWRGRGEVATLSVAEPRGTPLPLVGRRLYCGIYLNELLMRLTPRSEPLEALFDIYQRALSRLALDEDLETLLRTFELDMLEDLGYGPLLTQDADGMALDPLTSYEYVPMQGPRPLAAAHSHAVAGATLLCMSRRDFSEPAVRREALRLMRRIIDHHLDHRPLKSRDLFERRR